MTLYYGNKLHAVKHLDFLHKAKFQFIISNPKFERLCGPLGEIVTASAHKALPDATSKYDVITSFDSRELLLKRCYIYILYA